MRVEGSRAAPDRASAQASASPSPPFTCALLSLLLPSPIGPPSLTRPSPTSRLSLSQGTGVVSLLSPGKAFEQAACAQARASRGSLAL